MLDPMARSCHSGPMTTESAILNLRQWAREHHVPYRTAVRHGHAGRIDGFFRTPTGTLLIRTIGGTVVPTACEAAVEPLPSPTEPARPPDPTSQPVSQSHKNGTDVPIQPAVAQVCQTDGTGVPARSIAHPILYLLQRPGAHPDRLQAWQTRYPALRLVYDAGQTTAARPRLRSLLSDPTAQIHAPLHDLPRFGASTFIQAALARACHPLVLLDSDEQHERDDVEAAVWQIARTSLAGHHRLARLAEQAVSLLLPDRDSADPDDQTG